MNIWNQLPLLKILIPFVCGILIALTGIEFSLHWSFFVLLCAFLLFFILRYKKIVKNYQNRWTFGLIFSLFVFCSSYQFTYQRLAIEPNDLLYVSTGNDTLIADVSEPISIRENTVRVVINSTEYKSENHWNKITGKSLVYFQKDSLSQAINYGDKLVLSGFFGATKEPSNPGEFNFKQHLSYKGIHTQGYVKKGNWKVISSGEGSRITAVALDIRSYFLKIFTDNSISGDEFGVVAALLLGYTDKLDADLMKSYANTGVMHVLSVSGMHVGVIFIGLNFLLAFLDRKKWGKLTKALLLIIFIWMYAAITGFSPAVCRAAAMITFVIVGKSSGRYTNIYNTLAASALFLLLINPLYIADLGFQLSYISVIGIVMLQKPISRLWYPRKWFMKQVWLLISVSIAAQLATLPISIFYFHQFPNYFLFSNLTIVPFANIVIYNGILVLFFSPITAIAGILAKILTFLLWSLNSIISFIDSLPYSTSQGLMINVSEVLIMYFFLVFIILFFSFNKKIFFKAALMMIIFFLVSFNIRYFKSLNNKEFAVYSVNKSCALGFIKGREHILLSDSAVLNNKKTQSYFLINGLLKKGVNEQNNISFNEFSVAEKTLPNLYLNNNFIQFYDKRIGIISKTNSKKIYSGQITLDYLILSGNIKADIGALLQNYKPGLIIIDSSTSKFKSKKWIEECFKEKIPCYAVQLSGAYVSEI